VQAQYISLRAESRRALRRAGGPGGVAMLRSVHGEVAGLALHDLPVGAEMTVASGSNRIASAGRSLSSMKERSVSRVPDGFCPAPLRPGGALGAR